jgi:hypothetical protein
MITTAFTILAWAVSFGWLGVQTASKWQSGTALYILGLVGYQGALTFWSVPNLQSLILLLLPLLTVLLGYSSDIGLRPSLAWLETFLPYKRAKRN